MWVSFFLWSFLYLGSAHHTFILHVLRSCSSFLLSHSYNIIFSFISFRTISLRLSFHLPIFQCPLTSIFHVLITTPSCVFLSTCPNHLSLTSLIVSLIYATPALALISSFLIFSIIFIIPIIHLNILISVLSSKPLSVFPSAQVWLPYIRTCLMTVLYTATLSIKAILLDSYSHKHM